MQNYIQTLQTIIRLFRLILDFTDFCSNFADSYLDFADFNLRGDSEFLVRTRIDTVFGRLYVQTLQTLCSGFADLCSDFAGLCSDFAD